MKTKTFLSIYNYTLRHLIGDSYQEPQDYQLAILQIAKWLTSHSKPGLMIYGTIGTGKTKLAQGINESIKAYKQAFREYTRNNMLDLKKRGLYDRYDLLSDRMQTPMLIHASELNDPDRTSLFKRTSKILIIDDLGLEEVTVNNYGTRTYPFTDLLAYRYEHHMPTIITTNLDEDKISERYGERIADRIHEMFSRVRCTGESYRRL